MPIVSPKTSKDRSQPATTLAGDSETKTCINLHDWSRRERLAVQVKRQRNTDADKCRELRRTTKALIGRIPTYGPVELGILFSELLQIETALRFRSIQIEQEPKGSFASAATV
jgi:hypothetical protein